MDNNKNEISKYKHPYVCVDAVILKLNSFWDGNQKKMPELKIETLLYKRNDNPHKDKWAIPGGFLNIGTSPEDNISEKIKEKTGCDKYYLEQLYTFGDPKRDSRDHVISISYLALINNEDFLENIGNIETKKVQDLRWFEIDINNLLLNNKIVLKSEDTVLDESELAFDHKHIISEAINRIYNKIEYTNIAKYLLPEKFTKTYMQKVYELILNKDFDSQNFRKKYTKDLIATGEITSTNAFRPAKLYRY